MRILMKTLAAGPAGTRIPGRTYDVPNDVSEAEAASLIAGGAAVEVDARPGVPAADEVETGTAPDPAEVETATSRTAVAPAGRGRRTRG